MGWMPGVRVAPIPSSNYSRDGKPKIGVSAHHMDSSFASADGWFHNPIAQASSHFGVDYAGNITQWVDVDDVAYAQCMGNWQGWVTVENESDPDRPNDGPTAAQIAAMGRIVRFVGTPAVPATSMYSGGVGYHRQFGGPCSEAWGQTACPGDGFIAAIPDICAAATGAPAPTPTPSEEDLSMLLIVGPTLAGRTAVLVEPGGVEIGRWIGGELDGFGTPVAAKNEAPSGYKLVAYGDKLPADSSWYRFLKLLEKRAA